VDIDKKLVEEIKSDANIDSIVFRKLFQKAGENGVQFIYSLVKENYVSRKKYGKIIGDYLGVAYLPLSETLFDLSTIRCVPQNISEQYNTIVLYEIKNIISVASSDPLNQNASKVLSDVTGKKVSMVFSFEDEIQNSIRIQYAVATGLNATIDEVLRSKSFDDSGSSEELSRLSQRQEIKDLVDMIIFLALTDRTSDIHIEPKKHHLLLRYRRDGVLQNKAVLPTSVLQPVIGRIKVLAKLDITERRQPQDGRFDFSLPQHNVDIRISTLPSLYGEKIVMRLLGTDLSDANLTFESLGFGRDIREKVEAALNSANGMLFVTGPTGSGKTTTLHCALNKLCHPGINVIAIEDPIEYEHPSITQVAVEAKHGRDFPAVLRAVLRQDPDVIMIGEIRDLETAKIAANAALTGHMVLTSLHTNDSIQAVTRMVEMGVEHFVVAPSIIGVLGQRLVRKICNNCKESYQPPKSVFDELFDLEGVDELPLLYRGKGCDLCHGDGYYGRIAIHEYLGIDKNLRQCILKGSDYDEFYRIAISNDNYKPFIIDGCQKVIKGLTTFDEVLRVTNHNSTCSDNK